MAHLLNSGKPFPQGQPTTRAIEWVPLEKAGSDKGEEFFVTPTPTQPQRDTPPTLSCHCGWAMGRGRGQPRVGAKNATV